MSFLVFKIGGEEDADGTIAVNSSISYAGVELLVNKVTSIGS